MTRIVTRTGTLTALAASSLALGLIGVPSATAVPAAPTSPAAKAAKIQKLVVATRTDGDARLVLTGKGRGVKKARVTIGGAKYQLRKAKATAKARRTGFTLASSWREGSAAIQLRDSFGSTATVALSTKTGLVRERVEVEPAGTDGGGGATNPGTPPTDPGTPAPDPGGGADNGGGGSTPAPLFAAPSSDLIGPDAVAALQPYFLDSRFTDCSAGWGSGSCAVETRYSHMSDGRQFYCRLTNASGPDINSVGTIVGILGAEFKTDGSWAVTYVMDSYGNPTHYTWRVASDGSVTGEYWGPGRDPNTTTGEPITGLQWVRGGLPCDQWTP